MCSTTSCFGVEFQATASEFNKFVLCSFAKNFLKFFYRDSRIMSSAPPNEPVGFSPTSFLACSFPRANPTAKSDWETALMAVCFFVPFPSDLPAVRAQGLGGFPPATPPPPKFNSIITEERRPTAPPHTLHCANQNGRKTHTARKRKQMGTRPSTASKNALPDVYTR
eukprot:GHVT01070416.1.p2 GENE.GHVT01070416.1~~GHVT01070416.1.p2  ORF type:complete len:167 (-),score=30.63 GHVT01070416.1:529-1029(-)